MGLNFYIITHFFTGLTAAFLGLLVYSKNKQSATNRVFFLSALSVALWSISYSGWLLATDPVRALFLARLLNLGATFIPVFYLHWIIRLLKKNKKNLLIFYYSLTALFALMSFSDYYISGTRTILQFPYWPQMNWLYGLFLLSTWTVIIIISFRLLLQEMKIAVGYRREQLRYIFLGSIISFAGGSMNFLLMLGIDWLPPVGSPLIVAYPIFFSYTILKHRLMDVRVVLRTSSVYLASFFSIIIPVLIIKNILNNYFLITAAWPDYAFIVLAVATFSGIKNYYYRLANKYFFSSLYDARQLIADLSDKLSSTLIAEHLYRYIAETLLNAFHSRDIAFLIFDKSKNVYAVRYNIGFSQVDQKYFNSEKTLHEKFIRQNKAIVMVELKAGSRLDYRAIADKYLALGLEIIIPLNVKEEVVGLIALGPKTGESYNKEDIEVLDIIGVQSALAIDNALHYGEIMNFSIKLEKEVSKATNSLQKANEKLKQLDEAKSEFVSIASHQLRTPLTIIKGYVSMMLEGNFGAFSDNAADSLEKVYESNERLIHLVENLLNISRIESGRIKFNFEATQLGQMIASVLDELNTAAKKRGIELVFKSPKKVLPFVNIDREKIRQVAMNLIDNAIKYSRKGKIIVTLRPDGDNILTCISDQGMGMKPEDQNNLFEKFSRGTGTALIHTEGTGLGLYVAKQMIKAHHGRIWAESRGLGKGSKFYFSLPIIKI